MPSIADVELYLFNCGRFLFLDRLIQLRSLQLGILTVIEEDWLQALFNQTRLKENLDALVSVFRIIRFLVEGNAYACNALAAKIIVPEIIQCT